MPDLSEKTTYGSPAQPTTASFPNLTKNLQTSIKNSNATSADTVNSALLNHFNPEVAQSIFGNNQVTPTSEGTFPYGTPIAPPTPEGTPPPEYERFLAPTDNKGWVFPSGTDPNATQTWPVTEQGTGQEYVTTPKDTKAVLRNWPSYLGGGQYVIDPTQPGTMQKSGRVLMNDKLNPGARSSVLGGLDPRMYQVDHIIPLEFGGADTQANLEIYSTGQNAEKQRIQSVPMTLLANGKITLPEARLMAFTWKDKDSSGLPSADDITNKYNGMVPLDVAEKQAKKWQDDLTKPNMWKYLGESFTEEMGNFGKGWLPTPIREFAKGLVGGGTAGIVPNTGATPDEGAVGTVSNVAGNIVGTITGLGLLSKSLGWGIKGARTLMGAEKAISLADEAMTTAGLTTDIGNLTAKGIASQARAATLKKMVTTAGLLSTWGQLGLTGRELTGQQQANLKDHMTQFFTDVAFGGLLGSAGQTIKGYSKVALGTAALSLMEGQDIVPALQNAGLMTALHGMAYERGALDPKITRGTDEAYKMAATSLNRYTDDMPVVKKGQPVPEQLTFTPETVDKMKSDYKAVHPNDTRFDNLSNTDSGGAVKIIGRNARQQFMNMVANSNGSVPLEDVKNEITRLTVAENQLYNHTLDPATRAQKEWQDLLSMGEKLRPQVKSEQFRPVTNSTQLLNNVPFNFSNEVIPNTDGNKFMTGNVPTTGYGDNIDVNSKKTIDDYYNRPKDFSQKFFIVKDPETTSLMKIIEQEQLSNPKKFPRGSTVGNPDDTLRVFVQEQTPDGVQIRPAGYMPREESFDIKKNNLNKTYYEITNRLRRTIQSARDVEDLKKKLSVDKAQVHISDADAEKLFANKNSLKKMSDEDLYAILKPTNAFEKYQSSMNNSAISREMDRNGLNVLVADVNKVNPIGGGPPRTNPENPYLALNLNEQDWLRSIALRDGGLQPTNPIEKTIKDITLKNKGVNTTKAIARVISKLQEPTVSTAETITPKPELSQNFTKEEIQSLRKQGMPESMIQRLNAQRGLKIAQTGIRTVPATTSTSELPFKTPMVTPETTLPPETIKIPSSTEITQKTAPLPVSGGIFEGLVNRGKLTAIEAAPYITKEQRFSELTKAMGERNLEYPEKREMTTISKDLHQFLQDKGLEKKPTPVRSGFSQDSGLVTKNKNSLLQDAIIKAENDFEDIKSRTAVNDPESFISALRKAASGARSMITGNKMNLSNTEQRDLVKSFNSSIDNAIFKHVDSMFEGTKNIKGMDYSPIFHQYVGFDPDTGKNAPIKYKLPEERPIVTPETEDQKLAKTYGLALKDTGYLKLDRFGNPSFSDEFLKKNPKAIKQSPMSYWGSDLSKELRANKELKTLNSENFMKELNVMEKAPGAYNIFSKTVSQILKRVIVDPQEPWLKNAMKEDPGKSFTFNSLMRSDSPYMRRMFQTINAQGHSISQPIERILAQVKGASPEELKTIDEKTKALEENAAEQRTSRGTSENITQGEIATEGVSPEDLRGMSIKDTSQVEKVQDLTNFELRFPSLLYEELTGNTPPKEAIVDDAIRFGKDFLSNYNANIKKGGKIKKPFISTEEWNDIKDEMLGKKPNGKGGPYDGVGGLNSKFTNLTNNMKKGKIDIIARHGSTNSNGDKVFRGWKETTANQMTEKGHQDARDLGEKIKKVVGNDYNDYVIVSSDLNRAIQTAQTVAKISGVPYVKYYKDLRSQDTGDYTGKKEEDVRDLIEKNIEETPDKNLPGASESYNNFINRIKKVLSPGGTIEKDFPNKKIIVVTHHQVEVLHSNNFNRATEPMFKKGVEPGCFRIIKKNDGKGGFFDGLSNLFGSNVTTYTKAPDPTYNVRGLKVGDNDIKEAADILYGEISNRPDKQAFETRHVINTAINRGLSDPTRYGGSLTKVLQAPAQYQSYAPQGINKGGGVIESQYQKIKNRSIDSSKDPKYQTILNTLNEMKSGNFKDTTGGKQFYVHASDGSLWLGATQDEAKKAANAREREIKGKITSWKNAPGFPVQIVKR